MMIEFEGEPVVGRALAVYNAGDGLSEAMLLDEEFHKGQEVTVVLRGPITNVGFKPAGKDIPVGVIRVHRLKAEVIVVARSSDTVGDVLDTALERVAAARAARQAGEGSVTFTDALQDAHANGEHADGLVDDCPDCDLEADTAASETPESR